jgi:DNA-binding NarL/FixJ family response regulator
MAHESDPALRVFVVDDHEVVRSGLIVFLEDEPDLEVVGAAAGGQEALEELDRLDSEGRQPHVVLMDLEMAPMDGIELTRQIRARHSEVEVVALTSFGENERVTAALEAGASGYLLKDADPDKIAMTIRGAHRGDLQLDPALTRQLIESLTSQEPPDPISRLTNRERDILRLLVAGKANKDIAAELVISERTARTHVSNVLGKLRVQSRTQAALLAIREGFDLRPGDDQGTSRQDG